MFQIEGHKPQASEVHGAFFLAIVAMPMNNAYSMHNVYLHGGMCFLAQCTTKWPSIRIDKDRQHVLNNVRNTDWLLPTD